MKAERSRLIHSKAYRKPTSCANRLLLMIFCDSGHLQNEHKRPDMKRKHMNIDKAQ